MFLISTELLLFCFKVMSRAVSKLNMIIDCHAILIVEVCYNNQLNEPCIKFLISSRYMCHNPNSKVHGANMGPIWGRQDPGGPHVGDQ